MSIVPDIDDPDVRKLSQIIAEAFDPVFLDIHAEKESKEKDCFNIVKQKVNASGGEVVYGWQIWKYPYMIEAECHAVWKSPGGELLDISPKPNGVKLEKILFIQDPKINYEGKQIDNIRLNITSNLAVDHFIEACRAVYRLYNKDNRAFHYGDLSEILTLPEVQEIKNVEKIVKMLGMWIGTGATEKSSCLFCTSKKPYIECHGKNFIEDMRRIW